VLGFALSAVVQVVVSKEEITRLLPDDSPDRSRSPVASVLPIHRGSSGPAPGQRHLLLSHAAR